MNKKLKQILDRYPMLEADRNYIANLANTENTNKNTIMSVCMISQSMIEEIPEQYINALKSISDVVSYDNPTLISADAAHNILDLHAIVFHYDEYVIKPDKKQQVDFNSPLEYIYNGEYINLKDIAAFEDSQDIGFNAYKIIYDGKEIFQITHVTNENASEELGEEYSKLGFYIKNVHAK